MSIHQAQVLALFTCGAGFVAGIIALLTRYRAKNDRARRYRTVCGIYMMGATLYIGIKTVLWMTGVAGPWLFAATPVFLAGVFLFHRWAARNRPFYP